MIIDWKQVSKSPGYKSLKAEYIKRVMQASKQKHPMRDKAELYKNFQWVINRAKHYAEHLNRDIENILSEWERKRTYGVLNYYGDCRQPKFNSGSKKQIGIKGTRKLYKKTYRHNPAYIREAVKIFIECQQRNDPGKDKPRWSAARKKRGY